MEIKILGCFWLSSEVSCGAWDNFANICTQITGIFGGNFCASVFCCYFCAFFRGFHKICVAGGIGIRRTTRADFSGKVTKTKNKLAEIKVPTKVCFRTVIDREEIREIRDRKIRIAIPKENLSESFLG